MHNRGNGSASFLPHKFQHTVVQDRIHPLLILSITIIVILLATRILSGRHSLPKASNENGADTVPTVSYWIPLIGHIPNMAMDADGFVKNLRHKYTRGAFALNFFGTRHNIVYTSGLATALLNEKAEHATADETADRMLRVVFGLPKRDLQRYRESKAEVMACYRCILSEPSLGRMVAKTARQLKEDTINLVSFAASPVDEMPWERSAKIKIVKNAASEEVVEASLLPLIKDFCAYTAIPILVGSDFLTNFPDFLSSLWTLDRGFLLLASGLPRWLPIPALTKAHIARKKIIDSLCIFHQALEKHMNGQDPGVEWRNLDDVGDLVKARMDVYLKHKWSIPARASIEHSLLWAGNANSNALVFWMLNRIYADRALLDKIRGEVSSYVVAVQPKQELPIAESPQISSFDAEGLCEGCPLLKSCYIECLRLDTASWSLKEVKQDFVLQSRDRADQRWLLRKGEYAHAAHDLHNTDPEHFKDPLKWKGDRHIKVREDSEKRIVADMGSIRPYGGGSSMCKGRSFAFKECMAFAAAIVTLWDIEAAGGGEWRMPSHRKSVGVYGSGDDTRVWLRRRRLPQATS